MIEGDQAILSEGNSSFSFIDLNDKGKRILILT